VDFSRQNLDRDIDLTFIGSISKHHRTSTLPLMKRLSKESFNLEIYGPTSTGNALSEIGLGQHYKGPAWGSKMSEILANSKMVINRHTEFAQGYATNMRMYESTGMGSLLITDATKNLEVLFRVNEEVITYDDPDDAAGKVMNLLSNEGEIKRIATQAQIRTHTEHTYTQRVQKMLELFTP
jgi:spore maturation protein CgeB